MCFKSICGANRWAAQGAGWPQVEMRFPVVNCAVLLPNVIDGVPMRYMAPLIAAVAAPTARRISGRTSGAISSA